MPALVPSAATITAAPIPANRTRLGSSLNFAGQSATSLFGLGTPPFIPTTSGVLRPKSTTGVPPRPPVPTSDVVRTGTIGRTSTIPGPVSTQTGAFDLLGTLAHGVGSLFTKREALTTAARDVPVARGGNPTYTTLTDSALAVITAASQALVDRLKSRANTDRPPITTGTVYGSVQDPGPVTVRAVTAPATLLPLGVDPPPSKRSQATSNRQSELVQRIELVRETTTTAVVPWWLWLVVALVAILMLLQRR